MTEIVATSAPSAISAAVNMVEQTFHFKTDKLKDSAGKIIGEGKKHPSVKIALPAPTRHAIAGWLVEPEKHLKELELLDSVIMDQVYRVSRTQIGDWREANKDGTVTAAILNYDKLTWTAIANMPKGERASNIPSDEDINSFMAAYVEIMPNALNKDKERIQNHVAPFQSHFKKQRNQPEVLEVFQNALSVFATAAGEEVLEEHEEVYSYFVTKLTKMLKVEEAITLDSI